MSNYGPKKSGLYSAADNAGRKNRNSLGGGHFEGVGPNKSAKPYSSTGADPAGQEAKNYGRKSRRNPVLHLVGEAAKQYLESKKLKKEELKVEKNGQWKLNKVGPLLGLAGRMAAGYAAGKVMDHFSSSEKLDISKGGQWSVKKNVNESYGATANSMPIAKDEEDKVKKKFKQKLIEMIRIDEDQGNDDPI